MRSKRHFRCTCSLGRLRGIVGTMPRSVQGPFLVCITKFGCGRVTRGVKLPVNAVGDHLFFIHGELRGRLGRFNG